VAAWGKPDGVVKAVQKLRDEKVTRLIGVTGHESADLLCQLINMYEFDTILTTFNPMSTRRAYAEKVLPLAASKGMGIIAMKLMGGALGSLAVGNPLKNDGAANHDDAPQQAAPGMLVRYVLGLPIAVAIVGMKSIEQLRVNVAAAHEPPLDERERKALEARMSGIS
jgi:predicted aldo/keto reductase-like oxidoreductase